MSYLGTAVALVSVLCLVNLVLTFMLVRRLRLRAERIAAAPRFRVSAGLTPGMRAGDFTAVTVSGAIRSLGDLTGERSLVGFFSPGCGPCQKQLAEFAELAGRVPGGAPHVLAVVAGEGAEATGFAAGLDGVASVVIEPPHGPVATAFAVRGFPTFYLIGADGRIEADGLAVSMLPAPATT